MLLTRPQKWLWEKMNFYLVVSLTGMCKEQITSAFSALDQLPLLF